MKRGSSEYPEESLFLSRISFFISGLTYSKDIAIEDDTTAGIFLYFYQLFLHQGHPDDLRYRPRTTNAIRRPANLTPPDFNPKPNPASRI